MGVYLGVNFHARVQTVCWCDTASGVIERRTPDHLSEDVRAFYQQFPVPATVGLEATGYARWFHRVIEESGHRLLVGDALRIRQFATRRQKNDRRDTELLLDLHLRGDFPAIHVPSLEGQEVLRLLRYRHRLVGMRSVLKNDLYAVLLSNRAIHAGSCARGAGTSNWNNARVARVQTHPGVGLLTSLALVHTLEPVSRFPRARCVAAYCGLDPLECSSGDTVRFGHISKQGNHFLRFLLVEAGQCAIARQVGPDLHRFYYHLAMTKNPAVAAVAVARKLLLRLFCMLREQMDYDEFQRRGRDALCARSKVNPLSEG